MLSAFDEPTTGLTICEGTETGIAILSKGLAPVWACGGAVFLATFPVLRAIECLTIAADSDAVPLIGYTELRTNLPGGRHANVRTMRATVVKSDGTGRKLVAEELAKEPDTWTQFAGWSPDGKTAIIGAGWQSPENAKWEEENKRFRMDEGKWKVTGPDRDATTSRASWRSRTA